MREEERERERIALEGLRDGEKERDRIDWERVRGREKDRIDWEGLRERERERETCREAVIQRQTEREGGGRKRETVV